MLRTMIFIIASFWAGCLASQTFSFHTITEDGGNGHIVRSESYEDNHLVRVTEYDDEGHVTSILHQIWSNNRLIQKVHNFYSDGKQNSTLIEKFDYNQKGLLVQSEKTSSLSDNLQWSTYSYNQYDDLVAIRHFENSKKPYKTEIFDIIYDDQLRKIEELNYVHGKKADEREFITHIQYEYPSQRSKKEFHRNIEGDITVSKIITYTAKGQPKAILSNQALGKTKCVFNYNTLGKTKSLKIYNNDRLSRSTDYSYNDQGIRIAEVTQLGNGKVMGQVYRED